MAGTVTPNDFRDAPPGAEKIWAGAAPPPRPQTPRAMIMRLYGRTPRGGLNTKAAARDLGVSQRTVQRWVQERKTPPRSAAADRLKERHQNWRDSPAGRRSTLGRKRRGQLLKARTVSMNGIVRISRDVRERKGLAVDIVESDMARLVDAMADGDDPRAFAVLEDVFGDAFGGSVGLSFDKVWFE